MMKRETKAWRLLWSRDVHFDIDDYINPFLPPSQLYRLPQPISRFLGHRNPPNPEVGNILVAFWALVGAFCGILAVGAVFHYSEPILKYKPPIIFASLGATAILDYNVIQSPLAQPRASILGHGIAAISGVAITKLFMLRSDFDDIRWTAGAVTCAVSSALMTLTNTVHPPGGATALLAAVDPAVSALGWNFIPLILLGSALMLGVALLVNNIQRQYPVYWWTPKDVGKRVKSDIEKGPDEKKDSPGTEVEIRRHSVPHRYIITINPEHVILPQSFVLGQEEAGVLEIIRDRLRDMAKERHASKQASSIDSIDTCVGNEEPVQWAPKADVGRSMLEQPRGVATT